MENKVIVIGSLNYDVCLKQERLPEEGETYFADSVEYCSGGKGANQAVQAAKLSVPTYMVGCIGDDASGAFLKESLETYGVHTDYLKRLHGCSGMSVAQSLYDGGVRASVVLGTNARVSVEDVNALDGFIQPGDMVVLQLEIPVPVVEYAIDFCKARGARVLLNAAPATQISEESLKKLDIFVANELEAGFYCGTIIDSKEKAIEEISRTVERLGCTCVFTLGKTGSVVADQTGCRFVPSLKVDAVESTGAGDSFIGGLCYSLLKGMDIFEAAAFATCCSAKTVCKTGGQPAMPMLEEVQQLYEEHD